MVYVEQMPTDRFAMLAALAAEQHGLFTLADARTVGYSENTIAQMARRKRLERVSQGVYRVPFLPPGPLSSYLEAALWPIGTQGVLSHSTALTLWDISDVNPTKVHITVPRAHRPQRRVPRAYVVHREDLDASQVTRIEGIPVVTPMQAIRECAADHLGLDLLEQAIRHGGAQGLLQPHEVDMLTDELNLDRVSETRA